MNIGQKESKRIKIFDFYRGGAMLLVLLHHSGVCFGKIILAFHMPFFFFLSGYIYRKKENIGGEKGDLCELIQRKFFRLLVPYLGFEIINLILSVFLSIIVDSIYVKDFRVSLISILTCINMEAYSGICLRLWFLPCMFFSDILFYIIRKRLKDSLNISGMFFAGILISISCLINYFYNKRLPFTLDIVWMATAFIVLGYCYGSIIENTTNGLNKKLFFISVPVFLVSTLLNEPVYMYTDNYGNYLLTILGSISGSIIFVMILTVIYNYIEKKEFRFKNLIIWLGNNSLIFFPIHLDLLFVISKVLRFINLNGWYIKVISVLLICVPVINFIKNKFPVLTGIIVKKESLK